MSWFDNLYRAIADALFATPDTAAAARTAAQRLAPVIWLVGKTGAGKSSIVAVLTGYDQVEIGNGFAPCTRTARVFDYPEDVPLLRVLDTRGLEEPDYDPAEDISWAEGQSHLILAAMRVSDPTQEAVLSVLRTARKRHPDWPIVVAQTGLHDLYPVGVTHPHPDEFADGAAGGNDALRGLRQALAYQRDLLVGLQGVTPVFVPIDFTRAEDGYAPADYRSDALRGVLVTAGLQVFDAYDRKEKDAFVRRCRATILAYATLAAGGATIPVPFVDVATFASTNGLMLQALGRHYRVQWTYATFSQFFGAIGFGTLFVWGLRFGLGELLKLIPLLGSVGGAAINGALAFGMMVGLGQAACVWLDYQRRGKTAPREEIRAAFSDGLRWRPPKATSRKEAV